jgi:hypothetical protein
MRGSVLSRLLEGRSSTSRKLCWLLCLICFFCFPPTLRSHQNSVVSVPLLNSQLSPLLYDNSFKSEETLLSRYPFLRGGSPLSSSSHLSSVLEGADDASPTSAPSSAPSISFDPPTSRPTSSPSVGIPLSSQFTIIEITKGGVYSDRGIRKEFIINTGDYVTISGHGGINHYQIIPFANGRLTIVDFQTSTDVIDLLQFPYIKSLSQVSYTTYPFVILLPDNQKIYLTGFNMMKLSYSNFVLMTPSLSKSTETSTPDKFWSNDLITAVSVLGALCFIVFFLYFGFDKLKRIFQIEEYKVISKGEGEEDDAWDEGNNNDNHLPPHSTITNHSSPRKPLLSSASLPPSALLKRAEKKKEDIKARKAASVSSEEEKKSEQTDEDHNGNIVTRSPARTSAAGSSSSKKNKDRKTINSSSRKLVDNDNMFQSVKQEQIEKEKARKKSILEARKKSIRKSILMKKKMSIQYSETNSSHSSSSLQEEKWKMQLSKLTKLGSALDLSDDDDDDDDDMDLDLDDLGSDFNLSDFDLEGAEDDYEAASVDKEEDFQMLKV